MGESHHQLLHCHHEQLPPPSHSHSRMGGLRGAVGEIVEVQGGHIVRSTGRKDRHSKVCTAKGLRDRRVRLSAHTAIQFYDVQDRLGYDRPSKAVDWLIQNAKAAIDELAELPPWHPNPSPPSHQQDLHPDPPSGDPDSIGGGNSSKKPLLASSSAGYGYGGGGGSSSSGFLPPSLDSDSIADTIKSFFPMAAASATTASSSTHHYPPDLLSRTSSQAQDLRLSLQSFHDPTHLQHQSHSQSAQHALFSSSAPLAFDISSAGWADQNQRMVSWNLDDSGGGGGGYLFSVPPPHQVLGQSQFFTQRGPLQSSNLPSLRAWNDPVAAAAAAGHQMHPAAFHPSLSVPVIGFGSGSASGGFPGFRIPARIQGEEEHGGIPDKPPSASSASHH